MDNNITAEEFIERINNGERCFSDCSFNDVTIFGGDDTFFDKDYKYNLTFDNCVFERLELSCIGLNAMTICNCEIHDLVIKNTDIFVSNIFNNRITNLEVKDSHIDRCYICNIRGIKKSTIYNSRIYDSHLVNILIDDMIFSNSEISSTFMTGMMILSRGIDVFMLSKFDKIKIFQSLIKPRSYFYKCNFRDVVISESILNDPVTYESNITDTIRYSCPATGSFIGYKVVKTIPEVSPGVNTVINIILNNHISTFLIAVLEIPEDAKRSSAYTNKCRADKAKVLRLENIDGTEYTDATEAMSASYKGSKTIYKVGEMVYADEFDEKPYNECSNGIHFFVDRRSAVEYLGLI